jgi:predicted ATPase
MKIRKLSVSNYKVFDQLKLDFTDLKGNTLNEIILAGLNGCGKTTILELLKDILSGNVLNDIAENFEISIEYDFSEIEWYGHFLELVDKKHDLFDYKCEISIIKNYLKLDYYHKENRKKNTAIFKNLMTFYTEIQKEFKYRNTIIYRYSHDKIKIKRDKAFNNLVQEVSFNTHKNDMKNLITKPIMDQIFKNRDIPPKQIIDDEIYNINKIFDGIKLNSRFIDIESDELIFLSLNNQRIKFNELSSGEKSLYFMGFFLKKIPINNSILIIDEPEDSLHPMWQQQIVSFYSKIGEQNQIILATHSPHIIGSVPAQNVFLLKSERGMITTSQPKYSKGHSIQYVLSEIMETDYRDTYVNGIVDKYLVLISRGEQNRSEGENLWHEISKLDPNSEERQLIDLNIRRFKSIGK